MQRRLGTRCDRTNRLYCKDGLRVNVFTDRIGTKEYKKAQNALRFMRFVLLWLNAQLWTRREDALEGDIKVVGQVRHHVVVRQTSACHTHIL